MSIVDNTKVEQYRELGRSFAASVKIPPKIIQYIEARGFLCHELLCLLGGRIEFTLTPWWHIPKRLCDWLFGVFPICRWYPRKDSKLELIGVHNQCRTKAYRWSPPNKDTVVLFIEYEPGPQSGVSSAFFPYNVPQLKEDMFLRPPFNDKKLIQEMMGKGIMSLRIYEPLVSDDISQSLDTMWQEIMRGMWEEFCK